VYALTPAAFTLLVKGVLLILGEIDKIGCIRASFNFLILYINLLKLEIKSIFVILTNG
jgi:hypothetical protein